MFCQKCGKEIMDEAVICPGCGCMVKNAEKPVVAEITAENTGTPKKTSMILGIIGIVVAWLFALAGHVVSIIGIVLGIKEYKRSGKMTGLVLCIIGEVCAIFSSIIGAAMSASMYY